MSSGQAQARPIVGWLAPALCLMLASAGSLRAGTDTTGNPFPAPIQLRHLKTTLPVRTGDFDAMRARYLVRDFERYLNTRYKSQLGDRREAMSAGLEISR